MRLRALAIRLGARFRQVFQERQVFLRTGSRVRFVTLSYGRQLAAALILALVGIWSVYVSVVFVSHDARMAELRAAYLRMAAERDAATAHMREAYRDLLASRGTGDLGLILGQAQSERLAESDALLARNAALA